MKIADGIRFGAGVFVVVLILSFFYALSGHMTHGADVRAVCASHNGVANVRSIVWSLSEDGSLAVTCRDGFYYTIN